MIEEPAGQAASEKQSSPVQGVPSMIQEVPQHVCVVMNRAGAGSPKFLPEEFWLDMVKSAALSPATLKPVETSVFSAPRREG